jgi:hypothetical protein
MEFSPVPHGPISPWNTLMNSVVAPSFPFPPAEQFGNRLGHVDLGDRTVSTKITRWRLPADPAGGVGGVCRPQSHRRGVRPASSGGNRACLVVGEMAEAVRPPGESRDETTPKAAAVARMMQSCALTRVNRRAHDSVSFRTKVRRASGVDLVSPEVLASGRIECANRFSTSHQHRGRGDAGRPAGRRRAADRGAGLTGRNRWSPFPGSRRKTSVR